MLHLLFDSAGLVWVDMMMAGAGLWPDVRVHSPADS
jgi:hypothetical protein